MQISVFYKIYIRTAKCDTRRFGCILKYQNDLNYLEQITQLCENYTKVGNNRSKVGLQ